MYSLLTLGMLFVMLFRVCRPTWLMTRSCKSAGRMSKGKEVHLRGRGVLDMFVNQGESAMYHLGNDGMM